MYSYLLVLLATACGTNHTSWKEKEASLKTNQLVVDQLSHVAAIDTFSCWTKVDVHDTEESTEGGTIAYYYTGDKVKKIVKRTYGEMLQQMTAYYPDDHQLLFVLDSMYEYKRPMYERAIKQDENKDIVGLDAHEFKITERKIFFSKNEIIHETITSSENTNAITEKKRRSSQHVVDFKKLTELVQ